MFQIEEQSSRLQQIEDLLVQFLLSLIGQMMDRQAGQYEVEWLVTDGLCPVSPGS